jgi:hypothetical protein
MKCSSLMRWRCVGRFIGGASGASDEGSVGFLAAAVIVRRWVQRGWQ